MLDLSRVKIGDKVRVISTKTTIDGTLYEDSIVKIDGIDIKKHQLRVVDNVGKIWHVLDIDLEKIN
tara:strand:- start:57 stop:254 length:198 start_codon:yes stop_codon:yes gene_type:complete